MSCHVISCKFMNTKETYQYCFEAGTCAKRAARLCGARPGRRKTVRGEAFWVASEAAHESWSCTGRRGDMFFFSFAPVDLVETGTVQTTLT